MFQKYNVLGFVFGTKYLINIKSFLKITKIEHDSGEKEHVLHSMEILIVHISQRVIIVLFAGNKFHGGSIP